MTGPSDEELMEAVAAGDEAAFEALIERYRDRLGRYLFRLTGDGAAVEDLLQETFLQVYRARERYRPIGRLSTWIYTIAGNVARTWHRTRRRKPLHRGLAGRGASSGETSVLGRIPGRYTSPSGHLKAAEFEAFLLQALIRLKREDREAIVLCDFEELSLTEAAGIAGCKVKAFSSRISRARERLREMLEVFEGPS